MIPTTKIEGPGLQQKIEHLKDKEWITSKISVRSLKQANKDNKKQKKTYNSEDSLVVTHPTTNSPACGLSTAERTGSPVFHTLWSYVSGYVLKEIIPRSMIA